MRTFNIRGVLFLVSRYWGKHILQDEHESEVSIIRLYVCILNKKCKLKNHLYIALVMARKFGVQNHILINF